MKLVGWLSATFLILCGVPELYLGIKTGNVGASWGLLTLWFAGEVFGLVYTVYRKDYPLIANYLLNTCIVGCILGVKLGLL